MKVSSITWVARNLAGMMNEARGNLSDQMERLSRASDQRFADGFTELIASLEASLRDEESAMEAIAYPALRSHREQHARALSALHHTQPQVEGGDIRLGREALGLLASWLLWHRATMDLALASAAGRIAARSRLSLASGFAGKTAERQARYQKAIVHV
jgi:hemerythrin-like metal-binding protein